MLAGVLLVLAIGALRFRRETRVSAAAPSATSSACTHRSCAELACAPGSHPQMDADGCCRTCSPDDKALTERARCAHQVCAECPDGTRKEPVPGECCPRCVPVDERACQQGRKRYEERRTELDGDLRGCSADEDCMVASFGDACRASCPTPLNKTQLGTALSHLQEEAEVYCGQCAPERFECPYRDSQDVVCRKHRCEFRVASPVPNR